jgi:hypothetical protein
MPLSGNELADEVPIGRLSHTKERNGTGQGMPGTIRRKSTTLFSAGRRVTVAEGRYIGPGCLGDGDLKVRRPFIECISFLCRIGVAVIGANEFWRKVIKRRLCNVRPDLTSLGGSKSSNAARIQTRGTTWRLTRRASAGLGGNLALALTMTRGNLDHG